MAVVKRVCGIGCSLIKNKVKSNKRAMEKTGGLQLSCQDCVPAIKLPLGFGSPGTLQALALRICLFSVGIPVCALHLFFFLFIISICFIELPLHFLFFVFVFISLCFLGLFFLHHPNRRSSTTKHHKHT
jgi:hypothetical protein